MRILIITDALPFPPKSGRELPLAEIFSRLAHKHKIVIGVVSNDKAAFDVRAQDMPIEIEKALCLPCRPRGAAVRIAGEVVGSLPAFMSKQLTQAGLHALAGLGSFDWVWVSPVTMYGVVLQARKFKLLTNSSLALGVNDVKTTLYADSLNEMWQRRIFKPKMIVHGLRSVLIKRAERSYLKQTDLIHVQTDKEKRNAFKVLGYETDSVLALENGVNGLHKHTYQGQTSHDIAFMTHLNMSRRNESQWFIEQVWPIIAQQLPEARLVLIGRRADAGDRIPWLEHAPRVEVFGFADDLQGKLSTCRLGVVPTFHSTGLINRLQDMMACGLPAVSTSAAAATVVGLKPGSHCLTANDAATFAEAVVGLYNDADRRRKMSEAMLSFISTKKSWAQVAEVVDQALTRHR
jgi:glycosyltransferase involved in cell wall biosynthesis